MTVLTNHMAIRSNDKMHIFNKQLESFFDIINKIHVDPSKNRYELYAKRFNNLAHKINMKLFKPKPDEMIKSIDYGVMKNKF